MNDDWRVQIGFIEEGHADALLDRVHAGELEHDLKSSFQDRVIVSRDGAQIFLYAGDREQAEQAEALIDGLAQRHGWAVKGELRHWHHAAEEWRPADESLVDEVDGKDIEHQSLIEREQRETEDRGYPEFEAYAELPSHREARELEERLANEGLPCVRRWKYLAIGATDEDAAKQLAERIRTEAPAGSRVVAQGTPQAAFEDLPRIVKTVDEIFGQM